jgi:hypothetical protein
VLKIGFILILAGLVVGLLGKGWKIAAGGLGCAVLGIITGQVAEISLTSRIKFMFGYLTAKQVHDFALAHLTVKTEEADPTEVFLGKLVGEMEWKERQEKKPRSGH